ncbi:extracellular solute-binding protein [Cohnella thermotolerans]|jgi:multiple sugar transport system substrate-binding protein|uniref:extracellular solute-binding protein n=1 Tax=Cohnella thermotolerans TaxID=329858 RepID=UPI000402D4EC|nr:extracellular solute-binding protein [Cohnella thermotolerans]
MKSGVKWIGACAAGLMLLSGCSAAPTGSPAASSSASGTAAAETAAGSELDWSKINDPSLKGQEITLLWSNDKNNLMADTFAEFTKQTGIKVNAVSTDYNSLYNKISTAVMSNSSDIDVVEMDTIWAGQFLKGNFAVDLTNVVPPDVQKQFSPSSLESVKYDGHLVAIPHFSSTKHFYWNTELLARAGIDKPPVTWDQFREDSLKLKELGIYASAWSWKQAEGLVCDFVSLTSAFGGKFFDDNGKPIFNQGGGVQALQFMTDLVQKDKTVDPASLQWTENDVQNAFAAGKIAMMSNWEYMYPDLDDPTKSKVAGKTDVGLMPGEGGILSAAVTGSEGLAILQSSKHKEAALAFLNFVASKEFQLPFFQKTGNYPSLNELFQDSEVVNSDKSNHFSKIVNQYQYGYNRPNAPGYVTWSDALAAEIHEALVGNKTPQAALDSAVQKIESSQ